MNTSEVLEILNENYSITFSKLEFFRDGGSLSYIAFEQEKKYFLRIIRPEFMETALHSIDIHLYLVKNNIPVPNIVFSKLSEPYIEKGETNGKHLFILYDFIDGKEPERSEEAENIGCIIGKYHHAMKNYNGKLPVRDKHFFIDRYIAILRNMKYPESKIMAFKEHGDALWEKIKDLPRGYCHGDLYIGNFHQTQSGEIFLLDFDTSCYAFPLYDIALACNSADYFDLEESGYHMTKEMLGRFLVGYEKYFPLTDDERNSVFDLLAIYHYQLQATIIEIFGLDCVDHEFLDKQFDWLMKWAEQCEHGNNRG